MTAIPTDFSPEGYEALLRAFLRRSYAVRDFATAEAERPHLVLRHDLDMSLEAALQVAAVEARVGVSATYFVLLRSEFYNPFTPRAQAALAELAGHGHRIGLHFDASLYPDDPGTLDAAAAAECELLQRATGQPVTVVSFHRPARHYLGRSGQLGGRLHTYAPQFFHHMGYCSDSRGAWHHGHPLEHSSVAAGRALQLLTHPIWWSRTPGESAQGRLDRFAADRHHLVTDELAKNCEIYSPPGVAHAKR